MSWKRNSVFAVALLAALTLVAAGCGGGGKKESAGTTTEAATTEAMTTEATTTVIEPTVTETTETATTETETTNISGIASAANCRELADLSSKLAGALGGTEAGNVKTYARFLKEFAERAPEEIRADFEVLADAYGKIADALGDVDLKSGETPGPEVIAKLQKLATEIDQEKLTQASTNVGVWVQKNCTPTG